MRFFHKLKVSIICIVILLCISGIAYVDSQTERELSIHFIDVGLGDCIFISLPGGGNILVDSGSPAAGPAVSAYLKSLNIKKIDHAIFTHAHDDHIGGIFSIDHEFEISRFYDNGFDNFSSTIYGDYLKIVSRDLSRYKILQADEKLIFDGVQIHVLNPLLPPAGDLNNDSIVLKIIYGNVNILLAGDLGNFGERRLLARETDLRSTVLKSGHHGENDSTSEAFLNKVKPEIAIITVSDINKYARPHSDVLNRLIKSGSRIFRSDVNGNIILTTDGKSYSIKTERQ